MRWSSFEMTDGRILIVNMDEVIGVINHPDDRLDLCFRNGMKQTVSFVGQWENYPDIQNRDDEIQDLKMENDRLKQREEKMMHVIKSIACDYGYCEKCLFFGSHLPCADAEDDYKACVNLLNELEYL